ncbi:hypothetical protein HK100_012733 [Physocladia obscura]|uniref:Uncharacterized protein n=1 Tax=Physocladia obscura TaxID=109957 RepID=A0AAD5T0T4_9FUNG|nr:hypothetical protein HK100_012733 [Physocladia obscura]
MESLESFTNSNSSWPNLRGAFIATSGASGAVENADCSIATNIFVLFILRFGTGLVPGMTAEAAWTITNLTYYLVRILCLKFLAKTAQTIITNIITFIMFHWVLGVPFQLNQGEYEDMTLWEQMDKGEPFTPAKKYLTAIPIVILV